jgi:hypothetical protein
MFYKFATFDERNHKRLKITFLNSWLSIRYIRYIKFVLSRYSFNCVGQKVKMDLRISMEDLAALKF